MSLRLPGYCCLAALVLTASACVSFGERPPLQVIGAMPLLRPTDSDTHADGIDRQLVVSLPSAGAMLEGARVLARHGEGRLAYLAGVAWPDAAPRMLQDTLVEALQRAGFRAVERQGHGLLGDLQLNLQLLRFEVDYARAANPTGEVELQALLIDVRSGRALASRRFAASRPSEARAAEIAARSLLETAAQVLAEVAAWAAQSLSGDSEAIAADRAPSLPPD